MYLKWINFKYNKFNKSTAEGSNSKMVGETVQKCETGTCSLLCSEPSNPAFGQNWRYTRVCSTHTWCSIKLHQFAWICFIYISVTETLKCVVLHIKKEQKKLQIYSLLGWLSFASLRRLTYSDCQLMGIVQFLYQILINILQKQIPYKTVKAKRQPQ